MPPIVLEWLNLLIRWVHVIAAIMWIGDSFLFMWMDSHLSPPSRPRQGAVAGELWMVHSGGFYEVVKRRSLRPEEMPATLYWFMWQAYTTWITGFLLLVVVYYLGRGVVLASPALPHLGRWWAVGASVGLLALGWYVYDGLWRSPLATRPRLAGWISFALLVGTAYGLTRLFDGRAAFLQFGAMLGTIMATNVAHVIIPGQRRMLAATRAGEPVDTSDGERAKARSIHNHYLTLPVLFTMLSNHFPSTWGHPLAWVVLVLLTVFGAALKYVMNARRASDRRIVAAGALSLVALVAMTARPPAPAGDAAAFEHAAPVSYATVRAILDRRCVTCHSTHPSNPSFPAPPDGVVLEDARRVHQLAPRILVRAVITRTMPLGNLTGMTDDERATLGAWIAQGARIDGAAPNPGR